MISAAARERTLASVLPPWWLVLITGIGWMLVGLIVLRFDYTSVSAISILFGFVAIAAGVLEFGALMMARGWWKLLHVVLIVVFIGAGIVAFIHPGDTFRALAGVFSFVLVFAGTFDIILSISTQGQATVESMAIDGEGKTCPSYTDLRVNPPDTAIAFTVPVAIDACELQVHPMTSAR